MLPSRKSASYQYFEKLFFLEEHQYPLFVPVESRGQATSMAQKLNQCKKQHFNQGANTWERQQQPVGAEDHLNNLTAKAVEDPSSTSGWSVEISARRQQSAHRTPEWMKRLETSIDKIVGEASPPTTPAGQSPSAPTQAADQPDAAEDFFANWISTPGKDN